MQPAQQILTTPIHQSKTGAGCRDIQGLAVQRASRVRSVRMPKRVQSSPLYRNTQRAYVGICKRWLCVHQAIVEAEDQDSMADRALNFHRAGFAVQWRSTCQAVHRSCAGHDGAASSPRQRCMDTESWDTHLSGPARGVRVTRLPSCPAWRWPDGQCWLSCWADSVSAARCGAMTWSPCLRQLPLQVQSSTQLGLWIIYHIWREAQLLLHMVVEGRPCRCRQTCASAQQLDGMHRTLSENGDAATQGPGRGRFPCGPLRMAPQQFPHDLQAYALLHTATKALDDVLDVLDVAGAGKRCQDKVNSAFVLGGDGTSAARHLQVQASSRQLLQQCVGAAAGQALSGRRAAHLQLP